MKTKAVRLEGDAAGAEEQQRSMAANPQRRGEGPAADSPSPRRSHGA